MKIYNPSGIEIYDLVVDDSSVRYRSIMSVSNLTLKFSSVEPMSIPLFSYADYEGERYTLCYPENFKKIHTRNFEYTLTLHAYPEAMKMYIYKDLSAKPYRVKFPLTATPDTFIQLLVDVMNIHDTGWVKGSVIVSDEKLISFNSESCYDVLNRIAQEFDTEWEVVGKTIHLKRVEKFKDAPLALSYGKGNGFESGVGRNNSGDRQPWGRIYVQGGEKNINYSLYQSKTLLLPKSQALVIDGKTYRTDADGMYITRDGNNNKAEGSYDGSKFYPKRVGTVTAVETIDADQHFYDIIDTNIPASLDYSQYRIAGEKATIVFQSGALAGREFDLEQTDEALTGYVHEKDVDGVMIPDRRFKIVPAELDGYIMPGGVFVPAVGDKYIIFNISMPPAYTSDDVTQTGASWDMFREAVKVYQQEEEQKFSFTGQLDGIWSRNKWLEIGGKIVPGGHILFSDTQFQQDGIIIRITAIKDYVNKPHKPEITLSNASVPVSFYTDLGKIEADEVVIEESKKEAIRFTKRQWRDARETMKLLEKSLLNFSGSINPITVQTMQMLIGDPSLQFRFVNSKSTPQVVEHIVAFDPETDVFAASSGILQHMTLGINEIKKTHNPEDFKYWDMTAYLSPALDPLKSYYLYAKCDSAGTTGVFLLSEAAIRMDAVAGYYHFLVGILNSEYDGSRSFAQLYGFTEILPGRITTDKITSTDGLTYFDLVNGIIGGRIKFLSNGTETDLSTWADTVLGELYETEQAVIDLGDYVDGAFQDGVIEEAEAKAIEKYINQVNKEKADLEATYNKLYLNPLLTGTPKTNLLNAKITLFGDIDSLISTINSVIADGKATPSEKIQVDNAFTAYKNSLAVFRTRIEEANQAVQQYLKSETDGARAAAAAAESAANAASQDVSDLSGIVINLDAFVDGAFHDGVVEESEAKAIETYINQINSEKASLEATYNKLYLNSYLSGTPKTNLLNAKVSYFGSVDNMISSINSVIADGKVSPSEKQSINAIFATYGSDKAMLSTRIEEANKAIQDYLKSNSDAIDAKANEAKAITDKFGTTAEGGLISTVMMLLRELNSQVNTAGISGIQKDANGIVNQPAFWSGGTYEDAITGTAGIIFRHNSTGKIGVLNVDTAGNVKIMDVTDPDLIRLMFTRTAIPTVADILSTTQYGQSVTNSSAIGSTSGVQTLLNGISITQNSSTLTFSGSITISAELDTLHGYTSGTALIEVFLLKSSDIVEPFLLGSLGGSLDTYSPTMSGTISINHEDIYGIGDYSIQVRRTFVNVINQSGGISGTSTLAWSFIKNIKRFEFGLDGFMSWYTNNHMHYSESNGLDIQGLTNMPGVLLSGSVGLNGGFNVVWGAKKHASSTAVRNALGQYTVYHSVGHSDYSVQITPETSGRAFYVPTANKGTSSFVVYFTNLSGAAADANFSFQITGRNY